MKKQLLIAAVAATMSVAATTAFADISIKGDAHFRYANRDADTSNSLPSRGTDHNSTEQRVRLHVTGKSGDTTVKLGLRNDGRTRVSGGEASSDGADNAGSGTGINLTGENATNDGTAGNASLNVDYLYILTKIGALDIKAGDWWDTTGLGVARKGKADADRIEFSTKVNGWKLGWETGADSNSNVFSAIGKIGDFSTKFEYNTDVSVDGAASGVTASSGLDAVNNGDYFDVSVKGKIGSVGVEGEYFAGSNDTRGAATGLNDDADALYVHLWTKLSGITWHAAYGEVEEGVAGITGTGNKFSPLGVSIIAGAPGVNGQVASVANFGNAGSEDTFFGVRADAKVAGMGVQVVLADLELDDGANPHPDDFLYDIIVTRALGKGSNIKFSYGEYDDVTSAGVRIGVKF